MGKVLARHKGPSSQTKNLLVVENILEVLKRILNVYSHETPTKVFKRINVVILFDQFLRSKRIFFREILGL